MKHAHFTASWPTRSSWILATTVLLGACNGDPAAAPVPSSVAVEPLGAILRAIGDTARFTGRTLDAHGKPVTGVTLTWAIAESAVATIDANGLVTAIGAGAATVRATVSGGSFFGTAPMSVEQAVTVLQIANRPDSMLAGGTAALTATARDRNGHLVTGAAVVWTSSDTAIATVSATGVVTAVSNGVVTIRATSGGVTAEGSVIVRRPNLTVTRDTSLTGTVAVRNLTVPPGVTIMASGALVLSVQERATIQGSIVSDCRHISIMAGAPVTVTGSIRNACSDSTTNTVGDLTIAGVDTVAVENATISTTGALYITNDLSLTDASFPSLPPVDTTAVVALRARALRGRSQTAAGSGECRLEGEIAPPDQVRTSVIGNGNGVPGSHTVVRCRGRIVLNNATLEGQHGQWGREDVEHSASLATARGSDGGAGGSVRIEAMGNVVISGTTKLVTGPGGLGGKANAVGESPGGGAPRAADAEATGGRGGAEGTVRIIALGGSITGTPTITFTGGGTGGVALAEGGAGRNADGSNPAQAGGHATAVGGAGGAGASPGVGGPAAATGGRGGSGGASSTAGAAGGSQSATGGRGGRAVLADGYALGVGGPGGSAFVLGGRGGDGYGTCTPMPVAVGGSGGRGGHVAGRGGAGGPGSATGPSGLISLNAAGNGGNGGAGLTPGVRGEAGTDNATGAREPTAGASLQPGTPGTTCAAPSSVAISLLPTSIANTHIIGTSSCPQSFGTTTLTNTGNVAVSWSGSPPNGLSMSPSSGSLSPGQSVTIQINFTCAVPYSFTGTVSVSASGTGGSASQSLTVHVTVQ